MAEEKKDQAPATATNDTPAMSQGKPAETKSYTSVDSSSGSSTKAPPPAGGDWMSMMPMIGSMILVFYFLMIRPEKKRREQQLALQSAIKKGDKVILGTLGIYGTVADLEGDDATIIIDPKKDVRIKVRKDAIGGVVEEEKK